ncbi:MAG TPA: hypothetical protein C5S50_05095 [Methanosarcinaceae archaeon]|nr:hypothetical protein [Methanosarcinaceae archaeon]
MGIVNRISRAIDILTEDGSIEKGDEFEKYVVHLFDTRTYFSIVEWTSDISRKQDCFVESDCNPDLVMRYKHKSRNEVFCIECKYRSNLYDGKLNWSYHSQLDRYRKYAKEKGIPFYVVIGLGGSPQYPERMFCIPLKEAKYPALYPSVFEKYERDPDKMFFWKNGTLR